MNQLVAHPSSVLADIYVSSDDELQRVTPGSSTTKYYGGPSSSTSRPGPNIDDILNNDYIVGA